MKADCALLRDCTIAGPVLLCETWITGFHSGEAARLDSPVIFIGFRSADPLPRERQICFSSWSWNRTHPEVKSHTCTSMWRLYLAPASTHWACLVNATQPGSFHATYWCERVASALPDMKASRGTPLRASGQSSWLQVQRSGVDSRRYQIFWGVVGLQRGPLSLSSTVEELTEF
jgi:hypothetical protein